jgi:hypothetical protein
MIATTTRRFRKLSRAKINAECGCLMFQKHHKTSKFLYYKTTCRKNALKSFREIMGVSTFFFIVVAVILNFLQSSEALSPATSPEQIIRSQLSSLQKDDMNGVYKFASPANKQHAGDLGTFSKMVRGGPYKYLIGHTKAEILLESKMFDSKQFLVRVVSPESSDKSSKVVEYWWSLSRCNKGPQAGCFLVDAVIPNL